MHRESLLLIDTASLFFRAFFGVPTSLKGADGRPVNAVRGLLDALALFVTQYRPSHLACCWDNDWRPQWRVDLLASYKAHRVAEGTREIVPAELEAQVPSIVDVLHALGLAVVGKDGYEADDVIGTLAATATMPVDVVTGDRDLFQVVDDPAGVRVLYLARGIRNHEVITEAWLRDRYQVGGAGYAEVAVLRGDASDGLPGVAGIGEKTACRLVADHGDVEGVLAAAGVGRLSPRLAAALAASIDYLAAAREVVRVRRDLDLGVTADDLRLRREPKDGAAFAELARQLNLGGSADRILAALALAGS